MVYKRLKEEMSKLKGSKKKYRREKMSTHRNTEKSTETKKIEKGVEKLEDVVN